MPILKRNREYSAKTRNISRASCSWSSIPSSFSRATVSSSGFFRQCHPSEPPVRADNAPNQPTCGDFLLKPPFHPSQTALPNRATEASPRNRKTYQKNLVQMFDTRRDSIDSSACAGQFRPPPRIGIPISYQLREVAVEAHGDNLRLRSEWPIRVFPACVGPRSVRSRHDPGFHC